MKRYLSEVVLLTKSYNLQDFKDWLEWHLNIIKFDHVHVFDNESNVNIKDIIDSYGDKVSYKLIKGLPNQYSLYNMYINTESEAWWVLPIDDDEYLQMKNFDNVNDMLLYYQDKWPDMEKLSIRWKNMFPPNALEKRNNISLMNFCTNDNEQWANLFDGGNKPVKTFVKTIHNVEYSKQKENQTHNPIVNNQLSYMCNGERLKGNWFYGPYTDNDLRLLHYQYKSKDEWIWKCNNRKAPYGWNAYYAKPYENNWKKML